MPNRRSIYTADQASPSTYDTTFADFLDRIPDKLLQWEQMKLQRDDIVDQKRFRNIKYSNQLNQQRKDNEYRAQTFLEGKEQTDITNELNFIKMLPQHMRSGAMKTSKFGDINKLGTEYSSQEQDMQELITPLTGPLTIEHYDKLMTDPRVLNNPNALAQVKARRQNKVREESMAQITKYFEDNPDAYTSQQQDRIMARARVDPTDALNDLKDPKGTITFPAAVSNLSTLVRRIDYGDLATLPEAEKKKLLTDAESMVNQFTPSGKAKKKWEMEGKKIANKALKDYPWLGDGEHGEIMKKEIEARRTGGSFIAGKSKEEIDKTMLEGQIGPFTEKQRDLASGLGISRAQPAVQPAVQPATTAPPVKLAGASISKTPKDDESSTQYINIPFSQAPIAERARRSRLRRKYSKGKYRLTQEERGIIRNTGVLPARFTE